MRVGVAALANGGIVDMTAEHQETVTCPLLVERGLEPVRKGFMNALLFQRESLSVWRTSGTCWYVRRPLGAARRSAPWLSEGAERRVFC